MCNEPVLKKEQQQNICYESNLSNLEENWELLHSYFYNLKLQYKVSIRSQASRTFIQETMVAFG